MKDIHTETAKLLFKECEEITKEERQIAKKINFTHIYSRKRTCNCAL